MKCWAMVASLSLAHTLFSDSTACKNRKKNNKEGKEISLIAEGGRKEVTKRVDLVSHNSLLDDGQVLEQRNQHMNVVWASDIVSEVSQLLCQRQEDLILVINRRIFRQKINIKSKLVQ